VRSPRKLKKTSSGPAHIAKASKVALSLGNHSGLADTSPISRSEWPPRYLVPASTAMSAPRACGGKNKGVAQVLSRSCKCPWPAQPRRSPEHPELQSFANRESRRRSRLCSAGSRIRSQRRGRIVIACLDAHAVKTVSQKMREGDRRVRHEDMIAGLTAVSRRA